MPIITQINIYLCMLICEMIYMCAYLVISIYIYIYIYEFVTTSLCAHAYNYTD